MTRHVLVGRFGPTDKVPVPADIYETSHEIDLVASKRRFGHGIGDAIDSLKSRNLFPSEVGFDILIVAVMVEVDPIWWSPPTLSPEASHMAKTRPPYSPEFRRQMVELVRAGRDPDDLAREFEPTAQSIRHWVGVADRTDGRREEEVEVVTPAERDELIRLRRENKHLRQERDILSRAAAWFARETGAVPSGSSNS